MFGRVYKIVSKDLTYVGSTVLPLNERLRLHHNDYKAYLNGNPHYVTSYEVIKDEHEIQLIYEGEFENENSMRKMEGEYQRKIECVNKIIAGRTPHEYRQENREEINKKATLYRQEHTEEIQVYRQEHKEEHNQHSLNSYHKNKKEINIRRRKTYQEHIEEIRVSDRKRYQDRKEEISKKGKQKLVFSYPLFI
jgi:hypothetical protein